MRIEIHVSRTWNRNGRSGSKIFEGSFSSDTKFKKWKLSNNNKLWKILSKTWYLPTYLQKGKNSVEDGIFEVVGFDVAGDEGRFPLQSFSDPMAEGMKRYLEKSKITYSTTFIFQICHHRFKFFDITLEHYQMEYQ